MEILKTMRGRCVYTSGPRIGRDVITQHQRYGFGRERWYDKNAI